MKRILIYTLAILLALPVMADVPVDQWLKAAGTRYPSDLTQGVKNIALDTQDGKYKLTYTDGTRAEIPESTTFTIESNIPYAVITFDEPAAEVTSGAKTYTVDQLKTFLDVLCTGNGYSEIGANVELKTVVFNAVFDFYGNGHYKDVLDQRIEWRGRGNSTWVDFNKKPFRAKFKSKFAFEPTDKSSQVYKGIRKAKTHVFIANAVDPTSMHNAVAMKLAELVGFNDSEYKVNQFVPVNVYFKRNVDDELHYAGMYTLTEKYGIGSASVDIDENTGILIEIDGASGSGDPEKYGWKAGYNGPHTEFYRDIKYAFNYDWENNENPSEKEIGKDGLTAGMFMVKDPDWDELVEESNLPDTNGNMPTPITIDDLYNKWNNDLGKLAYFSGKKPDQLHTLLDMQSAARFFMVVALTANFEVSYPKSVFIYKEFPNEYDNPEIEGSVDKTCKFKFGPVWDYDGCFDLKWKKPASEKLWLTMPMYLTKV